MGHNTLGVIPRHVKWRRVIDLLGAGDDAEAIIAASADAAERDLLRATDDPVFVEAVRLLLAIPAAARLDDFGDALRHLGLAVRNGPELLDIVVAASARLDEVKRDTNVRTDLGELAGRALSTTLTQQVGDALPGLFEATSEDVQLAARQLGRSRDIAGLTRVFFTNLIQSALSYWLERSLADHSGRDERFGALGRRTAFDAELRGYAHEATRIIQEFSGGWYGKHLHDVGAIRPGDAASFGAVCLKKVIAELKLRRAEDA